MPTREACLTIAATITMTCLRLVHKHPLLDNSNKDEADATFMQQGLPFIDLNAANLFDPSQFSDDTMKYVHPKA